MRARKGKEGRDGMGRAGKDKEGQRKDGQDRTGQKKRGEEETITIVPLRTFFRLKVFLPNYLFVHVIVDEDLGPSI